MTHYIVKHSESDYRLHEEDGKEPISSGWSNRPDTNDIANQAAIDGPGGSIWGDDNLRSVMVDALSGGIVYRDLTIPDETVPWS